MTRRVAYIGNFRPDHATENDVRRAFEHLGWTVTRVQESAFTELAATGGESWAGFARVCAEHDLVLHTMTQGSYPHPERVLGLWRDLAAANVPTASIHLDLFYGLASPKDSGPQRMDLPRLHPMFRVEHVFTADGNHDEEFARDGVNHHWLPPAVRFDEARVIEPTDEDRAKWGGYDVAFVGSKGYHPEWPHRPELVDRLRARYGSRFVHIGGGADADAHGPDGGALRGEALNRCYATIPVFVGDYCFADRLTRYWSDRFPEVWGRGGFLVFPYTAALAESCGDQGVYPWWTVGDWDTLFRQVDMHLADPQARQWWREVMGMHVRAHDTYVNRVQTMLDVMDLDYDGKVPIVDAVVTQTPFEVSEVYVVDEVEVGLRKPLVRATREGMGLTSGDSDQPVAFVLGACLRRLAYQDRANAALHMGVVRYSSLTFEVARMIDGRPDVATLDLETQALLRDVRAHDGRYERDAGR